MNSFEKHMVNLGIAGASAFSLPRSVGSIFGLIFASAEPVGLDDLIEKLGISRGSTSMGLNFLLKMGAIVPTTVEGSRRSVYEPEMSLRRLLDGILRTTVFPHLNDSGTRLDALEESLAELPAEERQLLSKRLNTLRSWQSKARTLAPFATRVLGKAKKNLKGQPIS